MKKIPLKELLYKYKMTIRKDTTKDAPEGQDKGSLPFQWLVNIDSNMRRAVGTRHIPASDVAYLKARFPYGHLPPSH